MYSYYATMAEAVAAATVAAKSGKRMVYVQNYGRFSLTTIAPAPDCSRLVCAVQPDGKARELGSMAFGK